MKILKFNAVWCPSCLVMKQTFKQIEKEYPNIEFISYDYDFNEEEVNKYDIGKKLPVIIKTDDNFNEIKRLIGEKTKKEIISFIEE